MNFRDSYKNDVSKIVPDAQYKNDLLKKLEKAEKNESERKRKLNITVKVCSSCAAMLAIAVSVSLAFKNPENKSSNLTEHGYHQTDSQSSTGLFTQPCWYDSSMSDKQIYELFIRRLSDSSDLTDLYMNNTNSFTDDNLLDQSSINSLCKKISHASVTDKSTDDITDTDGVYYMAQFKNSDIIKFVIYDDCYVLIKNVDAVFIY